MSRLHISLMLHLILIASLSLGALVAVTSFDPASPAVAKEGKGKQGEEKGKSKSGKPSHGNSSKNKGSRHGDEGERGKKDKSGGKEGRGHHETRVEVVAIVNYAVSQEETQVPAASPTTSAQPTVPALTPTVAATNGDATVEATTELTDTTGSVVVEVYDCPIAVEEQDYDWFGACEPEGEGNRFHLAVDDNESTDGLRAVTDAGGQARFSQVQPGTYVLTQLERDWCHAKSDGVDANGNVIVDAGERTTVWVFTCAESTTVATD